MSKLPAAGTLSPGQAYFDINGDKDRLYTSPTEESDDTPLLTWRGDPLDTGSDFTIVVVTNELQTQTYHVHKSVLCFGTRQSKYFSKIMKSKRSNSSTKKKKRISLTRTKDNESIMPTTKIELDQRDADNFPIFLDFHYANVMNADEIPSLDTLDTAACSDGSALSQQPLGTASSTESCGLVEGEDIVTVNAVSLRLLAKKFENVALMRAVNKYIQKDLNFQTGPIYLYKAWEYKDDRLMESARRLCAENIKQIDPKALLKLPIDLFRVIVKSLESFEEENKELSLFLSEVVCWYLEKHPQARSAKLILELTDPLLMPFIAPEAAIGYTAVVKDLEAEDASAHWDKLVHLCRRCAKTVVQEYGWGDFSVNAAVGEYLGRSCQAEQTPADSLLFATSFAAALEQAQDDYEEVSVAQGELELLVSVLSASTTALEVASQRKDEYIEKQQSAIENAKQEILALRRQLDGIKRKQKHQEMTESIRKQEQEQVLEQMKRIQHNEHRSQQTQHQPRQQPQQQSMQRQQQQQLMQPQQMSESQSRRQTPEKQRQPRHHPSQLRSQQPRNQTLEQHGREHQLLELTQQLPTREQQQIQQLAQRLPQPRATAPQRGPHFSPPPMARHRHFQEQYTAATPAHEEPPDLLEMNLPPPPPPASKPPPPIIVKELISPASVGMDVHKNKSMRREELRTKNEMRARSLLP